MAKESSRTIVVAVDPGRDKCGYAVVAPTADGVTVLESGIVATAEIGPVVAGLLGRREDVKTIALGNGTSSAAVSAAIRSSCPNAQIFLVDERGTSEQARALAVKRTPARGIEKLLPYGLRSPNRPYDDVVAELIGQKFIESR